MPVSVERCGHVLTVILSRPEVRNPVDPEQVAHYDRLRGYAAPPDGAHRSKH